MKKILSLLLALTLLCSLSITAFADTGGDQTITLTVPEEQGPSWTLNIPADMTVAYRATSTALTMPTITNVSNLPDNEWIHAYFVYTGNFSSGSNTIPFTLTAPDSGTCSNNGVGRTYVGYYKNENGYYYNAYPDSEPITLDITEDAWNAAVPGTYEATITYGSHLVDH